MALPILDGNQTAATLSTIITGGAHIPAHTVVSLGSQAISDITSGVSGSVVSISNFPSTQTIAGAVTANTAYAVDVTGFAGFPAGTVTAIPVALVDRGVYGGSLLGYNGTNTYLNTAIESVGGNSLRAGGTFPVSGSVTIGSLPAISGTVTANLFGESVGGGPNEPTKLQCDSNGFLITSLYRSGSDAVNYDPVAGNVSVNVKNVSSVTVSALPSGAMTTRFGSVTTANTAQITSAVTNTSRKYLLAQNISAGTVTIGIGFSPTTTQGIQLSAGGGLTFDAFCPTGAVYWLGAVTGAAFTILEG